jgi:Kdo2-lipid IVA lauroyltransferase/acyltransferase
MARNKSPLKINLEYYPVRAFFSLMRALPLSRSYVLCLTFLKTLFELLPKRRALMRANIAACFPHFPASQQKAIAEKSLQSLARGMALYPRIPDFCKKGMGDWVESEGLEHVVAALKKGKGVICLTAHYAFWELMAIHVTQLYPNVAMVVRPLDNPRLDAMVTSIRASGGGTVIPHRRALKESLSFLRKNGVVGILIDQNFYKGGIFVDFFGRPAATTTVVSLLARRTGSAVLPMHNVWKGDKIRIICEPPVPLSENPDPEQAIAEDTQRMTSYVERWIREDPGSWLWMHNRWKRRPEPGDWVYSPALKKAVLQP